MAQTCCSVVLDSSDLELIQDRFVDQTVGVRFRDIRIPAGVHITKAHIQFTTDEVLNRPGSMAIRGQAIGDASAFGKTRENLTLRARTAAFVTWVPPQWTVVGETGAGQQTPDLSIIVEEIIQVPGWDAGHSMVFLFRGEGRRVAESFDGDSGKAALLHIEFEPKGK